MGRLQYLANRNDRLRFLRSRFALAVAGILLVLTNCYHCHRHHYLLLCIIIIIRTLSSAMV